MSRIHDALRKAQQERENHLQKAAEIVTSIAASEAMEFSKPAPPLAAKQVSGTVPAGSGTEERFIRFEQLRLQCAKQAWKMDTNVSVFANGNDPNTGAEQFRTLRSRLYRLRESQPLSTLLVTSALAGEGKTYVVSNLAQAIARQSDRRVLMIDADLRNSNLHKPVGAPKGPGLSDYLSGKATEFEVIQFGGNGNLCLIPGGTPVSDPTELISGNRLRKLIERMAPVFEWIILDSPPILPVSDASILAGVCDSVLMVVGAGTTNAEAVQRACLEMRERNLTGVVLNRADRERSYDAQYPYLAANKEMSG